VQQRAWDRFGQLPRGYAQVRAVRDWVRESVQFKIGTSVSSTSVVETLRDGVGVCRDFAHTMIAYCRALNYPARIVTGVDYGADPSLGPPDFHAYAEVWLEGGWQVFDPHDRFPRKGRVFLASGLDADQRPLDETVARQHANDRPGCRACAGWWSPGTPGRWYVHP
jgi:transglutaminase-like putative cysteine protease